MWRYQALLPVPDDYIPSDPVGMTPLLAAPRLAKRIGANNLWIKNDAVCLPTLSFKDRVVSVALENAKTVRLRHSRLLVDGKPGERRGRARRAAGAEDLTSWCPPIWSRRRF